MVHDGPKLIGQLFLVAICRGSPDCGCGRLGIALRANEARSLRSPPMAWSKPEGPSVMVSLGRVLVVEDEPQVALLLHDALQDFGYEALVAVNGHEALRLASDY